MHVDNPISTSARKEDMEMIAVPMYTPLDEYLFQLNPQGYSLVESGQMFRSIHFVNAVLWWEQRRDKRKAIGHSLAIAIAIREQRLSFRSQQIALNHDVKEDGKIQLPDGTFRSVTDSDIVIAYGEEYGQPLAIGVEAMTVYEDDRSAYYERFVPCVAAHWELGWIRLDDRENFHRYPYNGKPEKEAAKCDDTLGPFQRACHEMTSFMPLERRDEWRHRLNETVQLAEAQLRRLNKKLRRLALV